ncbi:MAG: FUSC family protein [Bacteroidetes bacterium]|nr:FUSC family protein [Bacteroidota bacterium]
MRFVKSYQQLNKLVEREAFEPLFSWGLRMAIAAIAPIIWGVKTNHLADASWITLTAECICWVELKGSFGQRLRLLTGGIVLAILFSLLGCITSTNIWFSVITMLFVGFISGLFKNLGDRGSGLAICVYVLFLINNAYPSHSTYELEKRILLVSIGGTWNAVVGILATAFMPARQPYRRTVAIIWKSIALLTDTVAKGWDNKSVRSSIREVYLKEKDVRIAIDTSLFLYETMAHQHAQKEGHEYELAQIRKATALIAAQVTSINEELEQINLQNIDNELRLKIYALLKSIQHVSERMAAYMLTLSPEDELLLTSRISRTDKLITLLKEYIRRTDTQNNEIINRIITLAGRNQLIIESIVKRLKSLTTDKPVYRSYSLIKTVFILHPKHWIRNLRLLFNLNSFTTRYAIRSAVAASLALFVALWFRVDHGYWIPFTVMIVLQPYFGATLQKAFDRVIGTVAGGIAGGIWLRLPAGMYLNEIMLFICFVLMVYFVRKNYSIAAFFITLSLVLLFDVEESLNSTLIITRALSTMGGAALAVISGFVLLPHWDTKWLPVHLAKAISSNYDYFITSFFSESKLTSWTKLKRVAEVSNSNAFDSFNRYMQEPSLKQKSYAIFYQLITHNVRITRELNNIHLDIENDSTTNITSFEQGQKLQTALHWFNKNLEVVNKIYAKNEIHIISDTTHSLFNGTLNQQQLLYIDRLVIELKAMYTDMQKLAHHETE